MKKVLIITYYWPPAGGVAVQRWLKFAKYLPQYGWQPVILTVKDGSYLFNDESLLNDVADETKVYRTETFEPFELYNLLRGKKGKSVSQGLAAASSHKSFFQHFSEFIRANFFIPDARVGWKSYAVKEAEKILQAEKIDAIITTGPPHSTHLIGLALKKKYGVKWIADFRDPWTKIFYNQFLPRMDWAKRKDTRLEDKVLKAADYTIVISNGMKEMYQENSPRIQVIYNSYDDAKFARPTVGGVPEQGFLFTYTGNFLTTQNVPKLWEALAELRSTRPEIKLLLIGDADATIKQAIEVAGIADMVIYKAYMPHAEVINYMWYSHLLLFLLANVPDSKLLMTGKVFEYLPTGTALMGIGPTDGSAGEVMKLSHRPAMIQYEDKEAMKQRIAECYDYWQQHGVGQKFTDPAYQYFAASNITAQLADLLNKITTTTAK